MDAEQIERARTILRRAEEDLRSALEDDPPIQDLLLAHISVARERVQAAMGLIG